jgi:Uma2 family endonuclease
MRLDLRIQVVTEDGRELDEPFLLRITGWTEERFFAEAPESRIWEFKDGEVIVPSPAGTHHQDIVLFLTILLAGYTETKGLGKVYNGPAVLRLRPGLLKEPDIFFVPREDEHRISPTHVEGSAPLVIEVISPSTRRYDLEEKSKDYDEAGVLEYWAVDSERCRVLVHRGGHTEVWDSGKLESIAVPGFWVQAEWLWQDPLPGALTKLREILA